MIMAIGLSLLHIWVSDLISIAWVGHFLACSFHVEHSLLIAAVDPDFGRWIMLSVKQYQSGETSVTKKSMFSFGAGGQRGECLEKMSNSSRRRLRRYLQNCTANYTKMITLTYPEAFPSVQRSKMHLATFCRLLLKNFNNPCTSICWVLEFQKRGAVHYHLLTDHKFVPHETISDLWYRATGHASSREAGTRIEEIRDKTGIMHYMAKYLSKAQQKSGDLEQKTGRFWGVRGVNTVHPVAATTRIATREQLDCLRAELLQMGGLGHEFGVWLAKASPDIIDSLLSQLSFDENSMIISFGWKPRSNRRLTVSTIPTVTSASARKLISSVWAFTI